MNVVEQLGKQMNQEDGMASKGIDQIQKERRREREKEKKRQ